MTTSTSSAAGNGLPKDTHSLASDTRQLFHLLDSALERTLNAPEGPENSLRRALGPLLGTSRDLARSIVVSAEMDRDFEAATPPVRPASGASASAELAVADHLDVTRNLLESLHMAVHGLADRAELGALAALVKVLSDRLEFLAERLDEMREGAAS